MIRDALISVVQTPLEGKDSPVFKIVDDNDQIVLKLEDEQTEEIKPLPRGTLLTKLLKLRKLTSSLLKSTFIMRKGGVWITTMKSPLCYLQITNF